MELKLDKWRRDWALMSRFFNANEISEIAERIKKLEIDTVAYCSFENRFAKSGGLASVTTNILPYIKEVNNVPTVILLSPFYPKLMTKGKLKPTNIDFPVSFNNKSITVELYEYRWKYTRPERGLLKEYYLKADGFFETEGKLRDPYQYNADDPLQNENLLIESSMFFCKAAPLALKALDIRENIIFHLQEWQTSLISLTSKIAMLNGTLESCATVQTMHNSYDAPVTWKLLGKGADRARRRLISQFPGEEMSAYQISLQLVDAPITTVSEHFAEEFTEDLLQTDYFAPHLQNIFNKSGVYGVNNGLFVNIPAEFRAKENHSIESIKKIKLRYRRSLLNILSRYKPEDRFGELTYKGRSIINLPDEIPIVVMSGRLDPLQKGYDILLRALEKFNEDEIKVILAPMPIDVADLDYFHELASKCRGNLTIFPIRMERGYNELQRGSTFGVMPSIYEPFGAAVEYMANGTVNIGRATGGLVTQVDNNCGFLFSEDPETYTLENIRDFVQSDEIVQLRKINPWVQSMAGNLHLTLKKAINMYQNHEDRYYNLIVKGLQKADSFNWEDTVKDYYHVYEKTRKFW